MTHSVPKRPKIELHKVIAILQWSKKWSTLSQLFLHMQHQSTTMICRFLKLFTISIFSKVAIQAKKVALKAALFHQILIQGKWVLSWESKALYNYLTSSTPLLEGTQQSLSLLARTSLIECNRLKSEAKKSHCQSCAALMKLTFHWRESLQNCKWPATKESLQRAILTHSEKATFRVWSHTIYHSKINGLPPIFVK